jgi:UDP-GlcNAc:undecaprenyl-phosphate GlcNAc-1-phosphate transferase
MGLSEKKAVIVLLGISLLVGLTGVLLSKLNFFTTLILSSVVVVCLLLFGVFLGGIKVYAEKSNDTIQRRNLIVNSVILYKKQILQIIIDIILISIAYISSYLLRYEGAISEYNLHLIEISLPIIILSKFAMFSIFGLYRGEWKYVGINDLIKVFKSVSFGSLLFMTILLVLYRFEGYSRSVFIIDYIMTMLMIGGCRVLIRVYKEYFTTIADSGEKTPILIVGAGDGGELLLREIKNNSKINYKPIGFIDDDLEKKGMIIHNLKVLGARKDIPAIVKAKGIKEVVISIPSAEEDQIKDIYEICEKLNIKCKRIRPLIDVKRESIVSLRYNELNREKESDYFLTELEKIKAKKIREWETKELREDIGWEGESLREDEKRKDARENK